MYIEVGCTSCFVTMKQNSIKFGLTFQVSKKHFKFNVQNNFDLVGLKLFTILYLMLCHRTVNYFVNCQYWTEKGDQW